MRKTKDALSKDITALDKEIEKADPLSCDMDSLMKKADALGDDVDKLGERVEDGHERLKRIRGDLDGALGKIIAEKRQEAMRKLREANQNLDELTKILETNMTQLAITDKELNGLTDEFKDKEKSNDQEGEGKKVKENDAKNVELFKERDAHRVSIDKQEAELNAVEVSKASIEDFTAIIGKFDGIIKAIGVSLDKAKGLGKIVDTNKGAA
jgi:chromosome segregation ATPase